MKNLLVLIVVLVSANGLIAYGCKPGQTKQTNGIRYGCNSHGIWEPLVQSSSSGNIGGNPATWGPK